jgi:hypothetical protein
MKGGCISRQGCCEEVKGDGWRGRSRKKFFEVGVRGGIVFVVETVLATLIHI